MDKPSNLRKWAARDDRFDFRRRSDCSLRWLRRKLSAFDRRSLTGVPDEILLHLKRDLWIGDYKTARCTGNQNALAPMYEVQMNCYALIASEIGLGPDYGLGLLYYEPVTEIDAENSTS
jgi:hypothetical protein